MEENRIIETTDLPGDSWQYSLRPHYLREYIGQDKVKDNLEVFIKAAKLRKEALDHVLLYGPPGLGKTTMAGIIANELGVNLRITSGPAIERPGDLAALLTNLQERDLLFIDEIHRLSHSVEEVLYAAMEDYALDIVIGKGPSARSVRIDLPPFTLVGATTQVGRLAPPLRDRFGVICRLEFYKPEDLVLIIKRTADILDMAIDDDGALKSPAARGDTAYCQPPPEARPRLRPGRRSRDDYGVPGQRCPEPAGSRFVRPRPDGPPGPAGHHR